MAFFASLVAGVLVYIAIRDAGWQLENEEIVGAAPVPAGLVAAWTHGVSTLPLLELGSTTNWAAGTFGMAAALLYGFVTLEVFVDGEVEHDRWAPRLVPPLCEEGQRC